VKIDPERGFWRFSRLITTTLAMSLVLSELERLSGWFTLNFGIAVDHWFGVLLGIIGAALGLLLGIFFFRLSEKPRGIEERKQ
jgi:hypothetical protein